jgi:hypothetical protein
MYVYIKAYLLNCTIFKQFMADKLGHFSSLYTIWP